MASGLEICLTQRWPEICVSHLGNILLRGVVVVAVGGEPPPWLSRQANARSASWTLLCHSIVYYTIL